MASTQENPVRTHNPVNLETEKIKSQTENMVTQFGVLAKSMVTPKKIFQFEVSFHLEKIAGKSPLSKIFFKFLKFVGYLKKSTPVKNPGPTQKVLPHDI